ncbi:MAG TPA: trypsin-like peptidase domain-containing protein [Solirubrobacteraceae bacterium]|jgi:S1-C subfamily serine protease|nr:trypsin-like peptidase domain-containing protein [Solirubrobacteraceae bacterium]
MKRLFFVPFLSALLGGGIVVAVLAAGGSLGSSSKTVTEVQSAAPGSTTPASSPSAIPTRSGGGGGLSAHEIYERTAPSVAYVTSTIVRQTESPFGFGESQQQGTATGSGFVINADGTLLTNWHVVENAVKVTVSFEHSKTVEAHVIGKNPSQDLAVLKIPTEGLALHALPLGDSNTVEVGEPVVAIGNPFDLSRTLTTGVISALQREITAPNGFTIDNVLQTDAPINPGNSGGPLLDSKGEVIGITSQIETGGGGSDGNIGIGFAVPINTAKQELPELEKNGGVQTAYLGVVMLSVDGSLASLNLPVKSGALIEKVEAGSPAAKAGLHAGNIEAKIGGNEVSVGGDIVVGFDGKPVTSSESLATYVGTKKPGETVTLELYRESGSGGYTKKSVTVTLGQRPNSIPNPNTPE